MNQSKNQSINRNYKSNRISRNPWNWKAWALVISDQKNITERSRISSRTGGEGDRAGEFIAIFGANLKISPLVRTSASNSRWDPVAQIEVDFLHVENSTNLEKPSSPLPLSVSAFGLFQSEIEEYMKSNSETVFLGPGYYKDNGEISDIQLVAGGGIERGETPEFAVISEIHEEIGLEVKSLNLISDKVDSKNRKSYLYIARV
jgi:hypothetical protein